MVKIHVGQQKKLWVLHEEILCARSEYFKKAFQGGFKEAIDKEITLPEFDPAAFSLVVDWIYGGVLKTQSSYVEDNKGPTDEEIKAMSQFCKLYHIAQTLCVEELQNLAMDLYATHMRKGSWYPKGHDIQYVYRNCAAPSPLHRYFAKYVASKVIDGHPNVGPRWNTALKECHQFALDVLAEILDASQLDRRVANPFDLPPCSLHNHDVTEKCQ